MLELYLAKGKSGDKKAKNEKDDKKNDKPKHKKPASAFILFSNDQRELVKGLYPNLSTPELG